MIFRYYSRFAVWNFYSETFFRFTQTTLDQTWQYILSRLGPVWPLHQTSQLLWLDTFECKQPAPFLPQTHTHTRTHTHAVRPYKWPAQISLSRRCVPMTTRPSLPPHVKRGSGAVGLKAFVWLRGGWMCVKESVCWRSRRADEPQLWEVSIGPGKKGIL